MPSSTAGSTAVPAGGMLAGWLFKAGRMSQKRDADWFGAGFGVSQLSAPDGNKGRIFFDHSLYTDDSCEHQGKHFSERT